MQIAPIGTRWHHPPSNIVSTDKFDGNGDVESRQAGPSGDIFLSTARIPSPGEEKFRVSRIWREIARRTTWKDSERAITAFVPLPLAPCVVGVAEEASGEAPGARSGAQRGTANVLYK